MNTVPDEKIEFKTQQERVYYLLREAILRGKFEPGKSVTLRGIASMLDVSLMPVRESLRRLTTERALELLSNRRIAVPEMTQLKLEEIYRIRIVLECEAAVRALPYIDDAALAQLVALNEKHNKAIANGDIENYIYLNFIFHRTLYNLGQPQVLMPILESLWLQIAPFMRMVYEEIFAQGNFSDMEDQHEQAIAAIIAGDSDALEAAIRGDMLDGAIGLQTAMGWPPQAISLLKG
ncbi:MAG: GntR family transcriptional regulator [Pseudomonadales bacterium]